MYQRSLSAGANSAGYGILVGYGQLAVVHAVMVTPRYIAMIDSCSFLTHSFIGMCMHYVLHILSH